MNNQIEVTPEIKAKKMFDKFRTMCIDSKDNKMNDFVANTCAIIASNIIMEELNHYMSNKPAIEMRPFDISGHDFWSKVIKELQKFE